MIDPEASFIGRGWAFPPRFATHGASAEMVTGDKDIEQSLHILFATQLGARIMRPEYGCDLKRFVFESVSEGLLAEISDVVERAVVLFEPRIDIESVRVDARESHVLMILLEYQIRGTNSRRNLVYPFYLEEATDLR